MTQLSPLEGIQQVRLTVEDFALLDRSGAFNSYSKTELIDGVILALNAQMLPHTRVKTELAFRFRDALLAAGSDLRILVEGSVRLGDHDLPEPDILICEEPGDERGYLGREKLRLAVEVSDTTLRFDLATKATLYARARVPEYWVVDLKAGEIHQMTAPAQERFEHVERIPFGSLIRAGTIDGLQIATDALA